MYKRTRKKARPIPWQNRLLNLFLAILASCMIFVTCIMLALFTYSAKAARLEHEATYQQRYCAAQNGATEHRIVTAHDGLIGRVDCLTEFYAIEMDFADKWAEAIGQSLFYAHYMQRQAGIVLILEAADDCRHVRKLRQTIAAHRLWIAHWTIGPGAEFCGSTALKQRR